ncbi:hypothetical protein NDU88_007808 [Pleurodeles waltl]|uniref:Uncharacterized protein n=1 Tax=Pleurodeles waltl TaxID=8319 RepID=A0AAV7VTQ6_PLEWA|nr:hypothetical protein NDU88_007808 [Pleurodeles waltl]
MRPPAWNSRPPAGGSTTTGSAAHLTRPTSPVKKARSGSSPGAQSNLGQALHLRSGYMCARGPGRILHRSGQQHQRLRRAAQPGELKKYHPDRINMRMRP